MIDRAAGKIAADGHAKHGRRRPRAIRAPTHQGQLVAYLVKGGPDVVEELNLYNGLHAAHSIPNRASYDVCLGERRIEDPLRPKGSLKARREFEDSALALDFTQGIFAVDDDARVPPHLVAQAEIDELGHRSHRAALCVLSLARSIRLNLFRCERSARRVQVFGIDVSGN